MMRKIITIVTLFQLIVVLSCSDKADEENNLEVIIDSSPPTLLIPLHVIERSQTEIKLSWVTNKLSTASLHWYSADSLLDSLTFSELDSQFIATLPNLLSGAEYNVLLWISNADAFDTTFTDTFYTLIADFALYNGTGAWAEGVLNEKNLLDDIGYTWSTISETDLNNKSLYPFYKALWMPGGWSGDYKDVINDFGEENIIEFVNKGNLYIGSCAGGYYASDSTIWEENEKYDNPLDFFDGKAIGPLDELAPWPSYTYTNIYLNKEFEAFSTLPDTMEMFYYGGGYYEPNDQLSENAIVLATYAHNGEYMALLENIGNGYYLITGCHPEVRRVSQPNAWPFSGAVIDWVLNLLQIELPE
ncbi:MAG: BPL-N domain-containing protein [Candidatus Marinimicrobia bacterium]|jgi:biotin--protein ligase|nr:BPL-N domain-containing protein [Candidatus Neomarinimicrobiota bacterium]